MKTVLSLMILFHALLAEIIPFPMDVGATKRFARFRPLDAVEIRFASDHGIPFFGISDLAYDGKRNLLYAVSDNGWLYTLNVKIADGKIEKVERVDTVVLRDKKGRKLEGKKWRDAEGMTWTSEGLLISFERKPRVVLYEPSGRYIKKFKLPKPLRKAKTYRGKNAMLEAVAWHPEFGLLTAPEKPLEKGDRKFHTLYSKNEHWKIPAWGSLTAMEVTPRGNLLVLERRYDKWTGDREIRLSLVRLGHCKGHVCRKEIIADLKTREGWKLDNFEGLTRVKEDRYLMVSDDNDNPFQKTVLLLFEISE